MTHVTDGMPHPYLSELKAGCHRLGLALDDHILGQLLHYQDQLVLWNKAYNLTAIRDPRDMLVKHLLDSLSILKHLPAGRMLDIGTGGGMPGFIVALAQPERECVLLDSNGKKIRFLRQITADMKLTNVKPIQARIEDPVMQQQLGLFDVVTSRAFASLTDFVTLGQPFVRPSGVLAAMKGQIPADEMQQLADYTQQTIELKVPHLDEQRHLIILSKRAEQA